MQNARTAEECDLARVDLLRGTDDAWSRSTALHLTASALVVPEASRRVLLRWLTFDEADALASEENVRETLRRANARLSQDNATTMEHR